MGEVAALQVEVPGAAELGRGEAGAAPGRGALQPQVEVRQRGEQPAPGPPHLHIYTPCYLPQVPALARRLSFCICATNGYFDFFLHNSNAISPIPSIIKSLIQTAGCSPEWRPQE